MKRDREIKRLVDKAGLQIVSLEVTKSTHYKAVCRNTFGIQQMMIFSATPSDSRGDRNKLALLRRFAAMAVKEARRK